MAPFLYALTSLNIRQFLNIFSLWDSGENLINIPVCMQFCYQCYRTDSHEIVVV